MSDDDKYTYMLAGAATAIIGETVLGMLFYWAGWLTVTLH